MRRQARISVGGSLVGRYASALQVWLWLLIYVFQNEFRISRSIEPGYLDFDNLPETNFTCAGKVIGGYYADLETSCQMFHVCTVGQQDEPMDIRFLCLNGTVFDQETRVCERVDEVDCTKSEKFYSLNLELYGSTLAPPIIQPDQSPAQPEPTQQSHKQTSTSKHDDADPAVEEVHVQYDKTHGIQPEVEDTTDDPVIETKKEEPHSNNHYLPTNPALLSPQHEEVSEDYQETEETDHGNSEYEDDYAHSTTTISQIVSTSTTTTTSTTTKPPPTTTFVPLTSARHPPSRPYLSPSHSPPLSSLSPPAHLSSVPSAVAQPTLDPSLLSPQEFIYRHRGPGSEAISFQRQSFRPADGVFITHAPPHQYDHFQYESSRTAPRPAASRPAPFVQKPQPFRPTTSDPRDQMLRPGPTSQSSERHEMSVKHKPQTYLPLPEQRPLPFDPFYFDRKRSDDLTPEAESTLAARSVPPLNKPKSPPRVIVTASASVSDSNGKRLNYTVGNVVNAVKPIVAINYDDYKESDLIFDPFFLDVPKLQKRRKTRSNRNRRVFTIPATVTVSPVTDTKVTTSPVTSRATTTEIISTTMPTTTKTAAWNPDDYVDDNYEPHAYIQPMPPLAIMHHDRNKYEIHDSQLKNELGKDKLEGEHNIKKSRSEITIPTSSATQITSSHSSGASAAPLAASLPPPPPLEAPACAISGSADCRSRA